MDFVQPLTIKIFNKIKINMCDLIAYENKNIRNKIAGTNLGDQIKRAYR